MDNFPTLTNLEDRLVADPNGFLRNRLISELWATSAKIDQALRRSQAQDQITAWQSKKNACVAAIKVIETIWAVRHRQ